MGTFGNAILGLIFLAIGVCNTLLMFKLWGYPFDHDKLRSSAPPRLMFLHRATGYIFLAIYLFMMYQMLPRLWSYQIELPARTVAHLILGMSIGIILFLKIIIVRFFKHLESTHVPFLGTALLVCTTLLIGLSVPVALKEIILSRAAVGGTAFSPENMERVKKLFAATSFGSKGSIERIASLKGLEEGRAVLLKKCVQCHDLRTVLVKPRTPEMWVQTVERMAERSFIEAISEEEQRSAAAYLIAISPDLQRSVRQKREQEGMIVQARMAVDAMATGMTSFELADAKQVFELTCSGCHGLGNVEKKPPRSPEAVQNLIERMTENGLDAGREDLEKIRYYLTNTYAR